MFGNLHCSIRRRIKKYFATFVIYYKASRAQQGRFESWWYLGVRMGKGFQAIAMSNDNSTFSLYEMPRKLSLELLYDGPRISRRCCSPWFSLLKIYDALLANARAWWTINAHPSSEFRGHCPPVLLSYCAVCSVRPHGLWLDCHLWSGLTMLNKSECFCLL